MDGMMWWLGAFSGWCGSLGTEMR